MELEDDQVPDTITLNQNFGKRVNDRLSAISQNPSLRKWFLYLAFGQVADVATETVAHSIESSSPVDALLFRCTGSFPK